STVFPSQPPVFPSQSTASSPNSPASSSPTTFSPLAISLTIPILPRPSHQPPLKQLNAHPKLTRAKMKHLTSQPRCLAATTSPALSAAPSVTP
ncbi:hypothetical protein U1Q18_013171, partial [Sarracenia purpurea var. burkii]